MRRARLIVLAVLLVIVAAALSAFVLSPRRYLVRDQLIGLAVFWHEDEAFVFVERHAMARSTSAVVEKLPQSGWWAAVAATGTDWRALGHATTAYRLSGSTLDRYDLEDAPVLPSWDLEDGRLVARTRMPADEGQGFQWTGLGFARLPAAAASARPGTRVLEADDEQGEEVDADVPAWLPADARRRLKSAGWHFKHLSGYEGASGTAALALELRSQSGTLTLRSEKRDEMLFPFATRVELTGDRLSPRTRVLFGDEGWRAITRAEFDARGGRAGGSSFPSVLLVLLLVWLGLALLKAGGVARAVLPFFGLKRRIVKSVATTMSFPPAIPEQFPALDRARLEAWSRDLEGLGFERLLDTSPVADTPHPIPTFCRIYGHRGHGCFGVLMQSFPPAGGPVELRFMLNAHLDDGWSVGASNGRPLAASAFVRRPRAIGFSVPGASPAALLPRFLQFRDQVSADLGVRPIRDTRLETYVRWTQQELVEIREAVSRKSLLVGLGQYYARSLARQPSKSQLVWLGDYPKVAEERRAAGLGPGFRGAAVFESQIEAAHRNR